MSKINLPKNAIDYTYRLVRVSIYVLTFIPCIIGFFFMYFSFWYLYSIKDYHLDRSLSFSIFAISFLTGLILFLLSTCGIVSALRENLFLAKAFLSGLIIIMFLEIGSLILVYAYKVEILSHASSIFQNFIVDYAEDDDVRNLVDTIQSELKCCGISSADDWDKNPYFKCTSISTLACSVPASCCIDYQEEDVKFNMLCGAGIRKNSTDRKMYEVAYFTGCKYAIYTLFDYKHSYTTVVFVSIIGPQLACILLIILFIFILNYLIIYDTHEYEYIVQFERNNLNLELTRKNTLRVQIGENSGLVTKVYNLSDDFSDTSPIEIASLEKFELIESQNQAGLAKPDEMDTINEIKKI